MAIYYISATGNDNNNGTTIDTPWQTLTKVNAATFTEGDSILFNKGDTFYGSITINQSGTSGNPITFSSYGTGVNPIITGFTSVTAWTDLGGNIWESTNAVSTLSTCNMVTINGVNTAMGRTPNTGYFTFQSHSGSTSITSSSLTGTPNYTGAEMLIRSGRYTFDRRIITSQSNGTINWTTNTSYTPEDGFGFFIQNDAKTLTYQNAWYYDPTTFKIRIYSTTQPTNIKVASGDNLLTINGNYITIDGTDFTGANSNAIYTSLTTLQNINIQNCNINFSGITGIKFKSNYLTINNCTILNSNNRAVDVEYTNNVNVTNNNIQNSGTFAGMSQSGAIGMWAALYVGNINGLNVEYNRIINSGYNAIAYGGGSSTTISNNFIDTFCSLLDDGAGIYGGINAKIFGNIVINGIGANNGTTSIGSGGWAIGIYFDRNSTNCEAYNNSIANCSQFGILMNNPSYINVHNNTIYNAGQALKINNLSGYNPTTNNSIHNNIFVAKTSIQYAMVIGSYDNTIPTFGTFDYNYYCRPLQEGYSIYTEGVARTLSTWQTFSSQDAHSHTSPEALTTVNDFQFEYNATLTAKTVTLTQPMIDVTGTKYVGSTTLQPFTSIVMMKDYNPAIQTTKFVITSNNKLIVSNNQVLTEMI